MPAPPSNPTPWKLGPADLLEPELRVHSQGGVIADIPCLGCPLPDPVKPGTAQQPAERAPPAGRVHRATRRPTGSMRSWTEPAMVTLWERKTQYGIVVNLPHDHTAASMNAAVIGGFAELPPFFEAITDLGPRNGNTPSRSIQD